METVSNWIIEKMRIEMPEIDDERAEIIKYGLQLLIGELPKFIILFALGFALKIGWLTIFAFLSILPYRIVAGGFHLNTHIGCLVCTCGYYIGNVLVSSQFRNMSDNIKYLIIFIILILSIINISLYAPADTVNVPILRKKERKIKKILSYLFSTLTLICAAIIKDNTISCILVINTLFETLAITRIAYKITRNEYGYEKYKNDL